MDLRGLRPTVGCREDKGNPISQEHPMQGFQSPALELDLAKAVRARDLDAAAASRLRRLVRRGAAASGAREPDGSPTTGARRQSRRPVSGIPAPRRSSG
jgi:hypothetical protein